MTRFQRTMIAAATVLLASAGWSIAQEQSQASSPQQTRDGQLNGMTAQGPDPGGSAGIGSTRRLGPGDGTGHQGARPGDGTGYGSPGRVGAVSKDGATSRKATGNRTGRKGSTSRMSARQANRIRFNSVGQPSCDGTRRHSAVGGSSGRRGGGRR